MPTDRDMPHMLYRPFSCELRGVVVLMNSILTLKGGEARHQISSLPAALRRFD